VSLLAERPPLGGQPLEEPPDILVLMVCRRQLLSDHARRVLLNVDASADS
jgi:hypothetical protein